MLKVLSMFLSLPVDGESALVTPIKLSFEYPVRVQNLHIRWTRNEFINVV